MTDIGHLGDRRLPRLRSGRDLASDCMEKESIRDYKETDANDHERHKLPFGRERTGACFLLKQKRPDQQQEREKWSSKHIHEPPVTKRCVWRGKVVEEAEKADAGLAQKPADE